MCTLEERNQHFFNEALPNLLLAYSNKYILIHNESIRGVYDTFSQASYEATKQFEQGEYIIRRCTKDQFPIDPNNLQDKILWLAQELHAFEGKLRSFLQTMTNAGSDKP